jgi:transcriptional regulator with XRE-family HTH domain
MGDFMIDYKILGQRIKTARAEAGYTQEKLAEKAGLSTDHISHIETANTKLSLLALVAIANALGMGVDKLLTDNLYHSKAHMTDEVADLFKDASTDECYIMLHAARAVKQSMRTREHIKKDCR